MAMNPPVIDPADLEFLRFARKQLHWDAKKHAKRGYSSDIWETNARACYPAYVAVMGDKEITALMHMVFGDFV
jgi:hypothetical protein